ncbi:hypothetical protein C8034_v002370 [Colletotrichum sidae]|uniref:Uncharacterized protein n=1 Tax=Colletotrichum sidae TaxID=1347389 RepID=A0A4R8TBT2_9PEZI|nr:hypothetical protein C8034_v002370 [Colletotrichum sidae]
MSSTSPSDSEDSFSSPPNRCEKRGAPATSESEAPAKKTKKHVNRGAERVIPCSRCVRRLIANPEAELCMDQAGKWSLGSSQVNTSALAAPAQAVPARALPTRAVLARASPAAAPPIRSLSARAPSARTPVARAPPVAPTTLQLPRAAADVPVVNRIYLSEEHGERIASALERLEQLALAYVAHVGLDPTAGDDGDEDDI